MKIIKTPHDLVVLRQGGTLPKELLDLIDDYFLQLRDELRRIASFGWTSTATS